MNAGRRIDVSKLASVSGWNDELQNLAYSSTPGDLSETLLLGHAVHKADLDLHRVKLCAECIRENGFMQAHFDLAIMVACPLHKKKLLTHCASCGNKLSLHRRGLLLCKCGACLSSDNLENIGGSEAQLLDIVRRKVLSLPIPSINESQFPKELGNLSLCTLLDLIRVMGKHVVIKSEVEDKGDIGATLRLAADALSEWPVRFYRILDSFGHQCSAQNPSSMRNGKVASVYNALRRIDAPFALAALSTYSNQNYGQVCRSRLLQSVREEGRPAYMSKSQVQQVYGISPSAIDRAIELNTIRRVVVTRGSRTFVLIDTRDLECKRTEVGELCNTEQAANMIGISPGVLLCLRKMGCYVSSFDRLKVPMFYLPDVRRFTLRCERFLSSRGLCNSDVVRLDRFIRSPKASGYVKSRVIDEMLAAGEHFAGSEDGTVGGILIRKDVIHKVRAREQAIGMSSKLKDGKIVESSLPVTVKSCR